ncbi:hypothetical protein Y032_0001g147 [Ancylostoma ceylanicum]|uniref:Uncharacterized protein n=1 Tax=Ancylostoma ceylanicum TaxID=53326 RepID=A0A016W3L8_9BILA|nr:hypothetical protein Y032_0001g147 [Ancylostoma ceylanicum]
MLLLVNLFLQGKITVRSSVEDDTYQVLQESSGDGFPPQVVTQETADEVLLKAVCQVVLSIKVSTESNSSRRAGSNDVLEIRKKKRSKFQLLKQNVILTWTSFSGRRQGGSGEKSRLFIEMNFSAAAIIERTSISVLEDNAVP